jgi:hypothetical protein
MNKKRPATVAVRSALINSFHLPLGCEIRQLLFQTGKALKKGDHVMCNDFGNKRLNCFMKAL